MLDPSQWADGKGTEYDGIQFASRASSQVGVQPAAQPPQPAATATAAAAMMGGDTGGGLMRLSSAEWKDGRGTEYGIGSSTIGFSSNPATAVGVGVRAQSLGSSFSFIGGDQSAAAPEPQGQPSTFAFVGGVTPAAAEISTPAAASVLPEGLPHQPNQQVDLSRWLPQQQQPQQQPQQHMAPLQQPAVRTARSPSPPTVATAERSTFTVRTKMRAPVFAEAEGGSPIGTLDQGEIVTCSERVRDSKGRNKVKHQRGWTPETSPQGEPVLEPYGASAFTPLPPPSSLTATEAAPQQGAQVLVADYSNPAHAAAVQSLMSAYAIDPMGGGTMLEPQVLASYPLLSLAQGSV